jgi:hypothetical protein
MNFMFGVRQPELSITVILNMIQVFTNVSEEPAEMIRSGVK